ncbi:MAG: hypothetical protein QXR26_05570 [Candidatus Caldarchaeum sp.]
MLTGNSAAAWGARVSDVDYIAAYPITPQSEIVETLSRWVAEGVVKARFVNFESEHSMITAAGAASLTGARSFTATSSQGLFYAFEALYTVSGWRAPIVLVNVARGVGMPMVLQVEHGDVLAARDSGFIQLHAETCQEVLDFIVLGYRVGEDHEVLLPVIVNMDGFVLSFAREPVEIPEKELVEQFLPEFTYPKPLGGEEGSMVAYAPTVTEGAPYTFFKYQLHMAALRAKDVFKQAAKDFRKIFGREHDVVERFMMDDAEYAVVCSNSYSSIIRAGVEKLRRAGLKVGMVRLKMIRPFPSEELREALSNVQAVAVFEQNISLGKGGALYPEVVEALYHSQQKPSAIVSFIGGLGGANIGEEEVGYMVSVAMDAAKKGKIPKGPVLVFREDDWTRLREYLRIAGIPSEIIEAMHHA